MRRLAVQRRAEVRGERRLCDGHDAEHTGLNLLRPPPLDHPPIGGNERVVGLEMAVGDREPDVARRVRAHLDPAGKKARADVHVVARPGLPDASLRTVGLGCADCEAEDLSLHERWRG